MPENIIYELLDVACVEALFKAKINSGVKLLAIKPIKKNIWHTTYHVVFRYTVEVDGAIRQVFVTAHDQEPREDALKCLQYLYGHGFGQGDALVPEPLFYEKKYNATFYYGLLGENLYHYIKENNREVIGGMIAKTAGWFAALHGLSFDDKLIFNEINAKISTISPGVEAILTAVQAQYPQFYQDYIRFYKYFVESESRNLAKITLGMIHGDAHPENIIRLKDGKVGVIDFVDMAVGDRARDIGSFLQQLDYMMTRKIDDVMYTEEMKQLFLTTYLNHAKISMTDDLLSRINLYYDWTAIRTATYFLMKHDHEPERALPLIAEVKKNLNIK